MEPVILASGSPRRQEYFRLLGLPFTVLPAGIEEIPRAGFTGRQTAEDFAIRKTRMVAELAQNPPSRADTPQAYWICGADTIVSLDGALFGKPAGREHAKETLGRLAGREHEVITAVALYNRRKETIDCRSVSCAVTFAAMSEAEIEWYLDTGEWRGAAGAYRIQGLAGCFISSVTGSPSAVAGLPLRELYVMLRDNGYSYGG